MREAKIQTAINRFLTWLAKKSVTALYRRTYFWTFSWGLDENTDLYLMSEVSYLGYHRFGVREEKIADTPQTDLHVKTPHKSRESHEKNCETCRDKDAYDEWEGNCDECENGSMYTPQTERNE